MPGGTITEQNAGAPTLTYNTIGRHISKMVNLKVVSNKSPWLAEAELGGVYVNPVSVDASCCAGVTPEKHAAALETMRSCQIQIL